MTQQYETGMCCNVSSNKSLHTSTQDTTVNQVSKICNMKHNKDITWLPGNYSHLLSVTSNVDQRLEPSCSLDGDKSFVTSSASLPFSQYQDNIISGEYVISPCTQIDLPPSCSGDGDDRIPFVHSNARTYSKPFSTLTPVEYVVSFHIKYRNIAYKIQTGLLLLICLFQTTSSLSVTDLSPYERMCTTNGQRLPVVWHCQGYIQCTLGEDGRFRAVWTDCAPNSHFDPSKMACMLNYKCLSPKDAASIVCPNFPRLKFPHPASCALFYDCTLPTPRPTFAAWENECPETLLFDDQTLSCVPRRSGVGQLCGTRPEPKGKCDYRLACQTKNCSGLDDGFHYDSYYPFSESFYVCRNGSVVGKRTCEEEGHIFDPQIRECTDAILEESVQTFCTKNPSAVFADPTRCSLLYDCSQVTWHSNLKPYQTECAYPRMFDTKTASCASFHDVKCGSRPQTVQPCDYIVGHCVDAGCMPCVASCLGLRDGSNAYPGRVLTGFYLVCQRERTIDIRTCPEGTVFDPQMRACLTELSSQTLDVYCSTNPNGRLLHPSECSMFYSCNQNNITQAVNSNLPPRSIECKYPYLVDAGTVSCKPHTLVRCGARREPFSPCDYVSNRCMTTACTRCELVMPSCYGKTNNYYPAINQEMTANYIICKDQRVMGSGVCPNGTIFDIRTLTCTDTVYPLSLVEYCTNYRTGRVQVPSNCAQYYDCAVSLKDVKECTYPDLYDTASQLCLPYEQVNCAGRPVFLEPCDSFTFCAVQPCPYCNSAYPSCVGRNRQVGGFRFEPSMYYVCEDDRLKLKYCQTTFNTSAKTCQELISPGSYVPTISPTTTTPEMTAVSGLDSPDNVRLTCQLNPRLIHRKADSCAQFYNCSFHDSPLGYFTDECPLGMLFDVAARRCLPYKDVSCYGRFEPKQVCDYQRNCQNTSSGGCSECLSTYPTCVASNTIFSKEVFPSAVIQCENGRAVNITMCVIGQFYDFILQRCTDVLNADNVKYVCKDRPNQLLPHPLHCARYLKCGPQSSSGQYTNIAYKAGECPYPLLFNNGLCSSYKTTKCGRRKEPITPCDYEELRKCPENGSKCIVDSAHTCPDKPDHMCTPCEQRYPSCLGSPNGYVAYPGRLFTPDFISCDQQRTLSILKCVQSIFDPDARTCGLNLDTVVTEAQRDTISFCRKYPRALIPHPGHCARFLNCSVPADQGIGGVSHLQECPHPQLFDSDLRVCQNFIQVLNTRGCGSKFQPKHYCDYGNICPSQRFPTCDGCRKALPSCENQINGIHGNPAGTAVTKGFMYCVEGRVLATSLCPSGSMFHESVKSCVPRPPASNPGRG